MAPDIDGSVVYRLGIDCFQEKYFSEKNKQFLRVMLLFFQVFHIFNSWKLGYVYYENWQGMYTITSVLS